MSAFLGAATYEDTKGRFALELPEKWEIVPQFGDLSGMAFRRVLKTDTGETPVYLMVHVDSASSAPAYAEKVEFSLQAQPGFKRLSKSVGHVGGRAAELREYVVLASVQPKIEKHIRTYYFEADGQMYQLHFESTPRGLQRVAVDVQQILASFKTMRPVSTSSVGKVRPLATDGRRGIAGHWTTESGLLLILGTDGSFVLDDTSGLYEIQGSRLVMIIPGKGQESFSYGLDDVHGTLTLASPNLGDPVVYHRAKDSAGVQVSPPSKTAAVSVLLALQGRWLTPTADGMLELNLHEDQNFTMGAMKGQWTVDDTHLILKQVPAQKLIEYGFKLEKGHLHLFEGDLDDEVIFSRPK